MAGSDKSELIPAALASALQNAVSIGAMSTIASGNRALDSALGVLASTSFATGVELLQKYKTWTNVSMAANVALASAVPSFSTALRLAFFCCGSKGRHAASPTDISFLMAPAAKKPTEYKHAIDFRHNMTTLMALEWAAETHGWTNTLKIPRALRAERKSVGATWTLETVPKIELGAILTFAVPVPVWRCVDSGEYVYMHWDREYCKCLLLCDVAEPLQAVTRAILALNASKTPVAVAHRINYIYTMSETGIPTCRDKISTGRTFDGLFFEQKAELLELLTRFKERRMYPPHLHEDNKLGILLHGPPGTGKTAVIAAIANVLGRDVLQLSSLQLRDRKLMDAAFEDNERVIFMDELDCLLDVIGVRSSSFSFSSSSSSSSEAGVGAGAGAGAAREDKDKDKERDSSMQHAVAIELLKMAGAEKYADARAELMKQFQAAKNDAASRVDMAYLLNKMQGLACADNRVIIATTNHPELIDPALKRKGRFDLVLHLGNCTPDMMLDMVAHFFAEAGSARTALATEFPYLPLRVVAPATVQNLCMTLPMARGVLERVMETST